MKLCWLKRNGADEVVTVFGGWAVGPGPLAHLDGRQDVLFVDDYRDLDTELPDFSGYARASVIAWSFGVAAYAHWQKHRPDPFARKVAISGSLSPISRDTGIPPAIFRKTRDTLSLASYRHFLRRIYGRPQPVAGFDLQARRAELDAVESRGAAPAMGFDRVWIASRDEIFPPANLARAWRDHPTSTIDAPHAPFGAFRKWRDFLE